MVAGCGEVEVEEGISTKHEYRNSKQIPNSIASYLAMTKFKTPANKEIARFLIWDFCVGFSMCPNVSMW